MLKRKVRLLQINQDNLKLFTAVAGFFVLLSYVYGVWKAPDRSALWGGIEGGLLKFSAAFMFIAAAGYLLMWYTLFFSMSSEEFDSLRWIFSDRSGSGAKALFVAFLLFLIPSMLWLESTSFHLRTDYSWTPVLVIGILALASIGNIIFILIGLAANADGASYGLTIAIGGLMISIQCILNDLIIWSLKFPW